MGFLLVEAFWGQSGLESNRACSAERLGLVAQTEPEQPNRLLGRTEPSPSDRVMPPSKPNRACTATEPSRADPPLGSVARCHTQIHANAHFCTLYVCYTQCSANQKPAMHGQAG